MRETFVYNVKLVFKKMYSTNENLEKLAEILYDVQYERNNQSLISTFEKDKAVITIAGGIYAYNDFEIALSLSGMMHMLEDCQWTCTAESDGAVYYSRIKKGVMEDCEAIVKPDGQWKPSSRWLDELLVKQKGS